MAHTSFRIIYTGIFVTKDLIHYDNSIDYTLLVTENITIKMIIGLDIGLFAVKLFAGLILKAVKIDKDDMHKEIVLI